MRISAGAPPPAEAVSLEDAMVLFDELADRPDIAFGYAQDGCYARAQLMCREMTERGLAPQKAWAFEGGSYLYVDMPDGKRVRWGWHVAPALAVRMPDGKAEDMVFDPGLFDGPVTLQEWGKMIHAQPEKLQIAPFGAPPKGYPGDYTSHQRWIDADGHARDTMHRYLKLQGFSQRVLFPTPVRQRFCDMRPYGFSQQGKTWVSAVQGGASAQKPKPPPAYVNR
ncbi:MAG: hypothetical protein KGL10_04125 [Alphaproteobacteria bacterium]|nr:hypothetical protein [Alphaproteobacteria bacterium]